MSNNGSKHEAYVPCIRGKHALGELVLVQKRPCVEPSEETHNVCVNPTQSVRVTPKAISVTPTSTRSTPGSSPESRKRRKRTNRRWANSRGKEWKAAAASPTVVHSPSLTVAMQPELDDVEGLLFVSFTSKVKHYELLNDPHTSPKDLLSFGVRCGVSFSDQSNVLLCDRKLLRFTPGTSQPHHQHLQFP